MAEKWPERQFVGVKIGTRGVEWLDQVALEESGRLIDVDITRSHVIRAALIVARQHDAELRRILRHQ